MSIYSAERVLNAGAADFLGSHLCDRLLAAGFKVLAVEIFIGRRFNVAHLLGLAKRTGAKISQASTSEVDSNLSWHSQIASYWGNVNPILPSSC